jgi:enoyl-CoA hydratase/carnithine racemase
VEWHTVHYDVDDGVAIVTLHRPERGNAWTGRMELEYRTALATAEEDDAVGAIVITGAGRSFCVGADAQALEGIASAGDYDDGVREPLPQPGDRSHPVSATRHGFLLTIPKPVIAAVNGGVAGVGFALLCFTDIRFAAAGARITTSFAKLGLPAEHGVSWMLPRLIGSGRATELLLSSRIITAEEALDLGIVSAVHAPEDLLPAVLDYARTLATERSPAAVRTMKRQLLADWHRSLPESAAESVELMNRMVTEADFREGAAALSERRPPRFRS